MDLHLIGINFRSVRDLFPQNSLRKNYFLASCLTLDKGVNLPFINEDCRYGGTIGMGDSYLDNVLKHFKIIRLHAILHDSTGYMKQKFGIGPGYCYNLSNCPINCCFLGHVSGLIYCMYMKVFSTEFQEIDC